MLGVVSVDAMLQQMTPREFRERLAYRILEIEEAKDTSGTTTMNHDEIERGLDVLAGMAGAT